jgi:Ribbon-helix-helix protein, copG family
MATNLRLRPDAEEALREAAERRGLSQQHLIREAVDRYLGLSEPPGHQTDDGLAGHGVPAVRMPFRELDSLVRLPEGVTTLDLLDRDERF